MATKVSRVDQLTSVIGKISLNDSPKSDTRSRGSNQFEQTQLQKDMDLMFEKQAREKLADVPEYEMPSQFRPGLTLFDHQKEGICWLIHQERSGGAEAFYTEIKCANGQKAWICNISNKVQLIPPKRAKGSILADGTYGRRSVT